MVEWTTPNQKIFREVLLDFYTSNQQLRLFVLDAFTYSLDTLPDIRDTRPVWAAALLEEAVAAGWINELYKKFCSVYQNDPRIIVLKKDLKDPLLAGKIGESQDSNLVVRREVEGELNEDLGSTHLVIAIFWQKPSEKRIQIRPKFCYRDSNNREIIREDLFREDGYSEILENFPAFLTKFVDFTICNKISRYFTNPLEPWQLTIELFVPVELLCKPLETWCGKNKDLIRNRPIVVGCSDRFNPDQPEKALDLHNQLKLGWKRFQEKVPDRAGQKLKNLAWLTSATAKTESFEKYSGFQCYGDWLKPEEDHLKNWQELVRSGIPIALWICEGSIDSPEISKLFGYLIDTTRFEFLERIRLIRDQHQKTSNHCVGVFYEDPHYVPDEPSLPVKQFFVWPGA